MIDTLGTCFTGQRDRCASNRQRASDSCRRTIISQSRILPLELLLVVFLTACGQQPPETASTPQPAELSGNTSPPVTVSSNAKSRESKPVDSFSSPSATPKSRPEPTTTIEDFQASPRPDSPPPTFSRQEETSRQEDPNYAPANTTSPETGKLASLPRTPLPVAKNTTAPERLPVSIEPQSPETKTIPRDLAKEKRAVQEPKSSGPIEKPSRPASGIATQKAVREILVDVWGQSSRKTTQLGRAAVTRGRRTKADVDTVNHAYGVLLLHHGQWKAADTIFRKLAGSDTADSDASLGLAFAQMGRGQGDRSIETLSQLVDLSPKSDRTSATIATLSIFHRAKPIRNLDSSKLADLERRLFGKMSPTEQNAYQSHVEQTKSYVKSLPRLREKMMEALTEAKARLSRMQAEYARTLALRNSLLRSYRSAIARAESFATQIATANAVNDRLAATRLLLLSQEASRAAEEAKRRGVALERLLSRMQPPIRQLSTEIQTETRIIDGKLSVPPLPIASPEYRDQLLDAVDAFARDGISPKRDKKLRHRPAVVGKVAKKTPTSDDAKEKSANTLTKDARRARSLVSLGKQLHRSGKTEKAKEYFRKVTSLYPDSDAAKEAKEMLRSLD